MCRVVLRGNIWTRLSISFVGNIILDQVKQEFRNLYLNFLCISELSINGAVPTAPHIRRVHHNLSVDVIKLVGTTVFTK